MIEPMTDEWQAFLRQSYDEEAASEEEIEREYAQVGDVFEERVERIHELLQTNPNVKSHAEIIKLTGITNKGAVANALARLGAAKKGKFYALPEA